MSFVAISILILKPLMKKNWYWFLFKLVVDMRVSGFQGKIGLNSKQPLQQMQPQQQVLQLNKMSGNSVQWRRRFLVLWVVAGALSSMWIYWYMNDNIVTRRRESLANMCDERARMLQDQFNVSMNHVGALAILISTFHHGKQPSAIDQETFAEYTKRTAFERPLTSGVAYALKVVNSEREEFEKQQGWTIKKMGTHDKSRAQDEYIPEKLDPAPVQDEYAPVIFTQDTMSHIVSIDMMSGKEDRENILRARASGKGVLTSPFKLLKSNHLGVVLTFAVYKANLPPDATPEERSEAAEGYLGAAFDVPSLVEKLLQQLASKQTIVVNVYDITNSSSPINMYGPNTTSSDLHHISSLDFGDPYRRHEMRCRFKQKPPWPWSAIMMSSGVLVIALLIGHILHAAVNRIAKVEDDYIAMKELKVRAEAADVAKSQFLATVSHEIRTPMNGVLGMLQMLMDTNLDATQQDFARTAQSSGKALITLINEVLDQAKIESGRMELEAVPFEPRTILDNVVSLFAGKSQDKHIELAAYVSDQVPEILIGDPGRLRQIITNLVGNSIKFTEEGHIFVSIQLAEEVRTSCDRNDELLMKESESLVNRQLEPYGTLSGHRVVDRRKSWESFKKIRNISSHPLETTDSIILLVTVEDTGVGIPLDAQGRIFMPFVQANSSTSRTHGGTGIGLSISKCLIDLMGGEIGFVSEPKVGSTFAFTAVFGKGQGNAQEVTRRLQESATAELEQLRALVVDGRGVRAQVTKYQLERLGLEVETALDIQSACSCISKSCTPSASKNMVMVLVDKQAWGMELTELAFPRLVKEKLQKSILNESATSKFPKMILMATSITQSEIEEAKAAGYVEHIILKPLRASMMGACLQQVLGLGNKQEKQSQPASLRNLLSGRQILVVDDNVVNRRVAAGALKKYGATIACAESGKEAVSMLQPPHNFDACFMDIQMPEMDGFEATRRVRYSEQKVNDLVKSGEASEDAYGGKCEWHIPILAMTADVIQATHDECKKCGMDGYVSKPFEEEQLYSAVAHFLESESKPNKLACC